MLRHSPLRRLKKRTLVVTVLSMAAVLITGSLLGWFVAALPGPSDITQFVIAERDSRHSILGSGVSLPELPVANWLEDPSFEPYVFRTALTVHYGNENILTVSAADAGAGQYGESFFNGAQARVMAWSADGLSHKKTAAVVSFGMNRVGQFQTIDLSGDWPENTAVLAITQQNEISLAAGENGLVLFQASSVAPQVIDLNVSADLTGIDGFDKGYVICSEQGDLFFSEQGTLWQKISGTLEGSLNDIAIADDSTYAAVGDEGIIICGKPGQTPVAVQAPTKQDLLAACSGAGRFVAVGEQGTILVSRGGLIWQSADLAVDINWQTVEFYEGRFVAAGDKGHIAYSDNGINFQLLEPVGSSDLVDVVMLSRQQYIVLDKQGLFSLTNDAGHSWTSSEIETGMHSQIIALAGKDKLISADAFGQVGVAQLVAEIELDSPLRQGQYQAGDILYLEKVSPSLPSEYLEDFDQSSAVVNSWQFFGPGRSNRIESDHAPAGGRASLLIDRTDVQADQPTIISQVLGAKFSEQSRHNDIYRADLWLKQENSGAGKVQVWLSGLVNPVGATVSHIGPKWRKYSFNFVLPEPSTLREQPVRFNVAFTGTAKVSIDRLFFGKASESADLALSSVSEQIKDADPQVIRLDFLGIGKRGSGVESWSLPLGNENKYISPGENNLQKSHALHTALQLAYESSASPWLVIDAFADEAELLRLIEYLAAPITEPYGRLRQQNGSVVPWTDKFDRIYLEFMDSEKIFEFDRLRADHVNLMIDSVSRSPYYQRIKQMLVFIDGQYYQEGVMLSTADYHSADLQGIMQTNRESVVYNAYQDYYNQIPRVPEKPGQLISELVRSASLVASELYQPQLADLIHLLLADLGEQTALTNLEIDVNSLTNTDDKDLYLTAAHIMARSAQGVPLSIHPIQQVNENKDDPEELEKWVSARAYGFLSNDQLAIVLVNSTEQRQDCLLVSDMNLKGAQVTNYDASGAELNQQELKNNQKVTLLPGGVALLYKSLTPDG